MSYQIHSCAVSTNYNHWKHNMGDLGSWNEKITCTSTYIIYTYILRVKVNIENKSECKFPGRGYTIKLCFNWVLNEKQSIQLSSNSGKSNQIPKPRKIKLNIYPNGFPILFQICVNLNWQFVQLFKILKSKLVILQ